VFSAWRVFPGATSETQLYAEDINDELAQVVADFTAIDPGGTDSGRLIVQDGFAAALGTVAIGASAGHMQNQWSGYTFGGRPAVGDREGGQAGRRCRGRFLAHV